jgi:hypothetical protein
MNKKQFVSLFTLLCAAFVPVVLVAGLSWCFLPLSGILIELPKWSIRDVWLPMLFVTGYISLYIGLGIYLYWVIDGIPETKMRLFAAVFMLALPIACSFAHVLHCGSIRGGSGRYSFWEALTHWFKS